MFAGLLSISKGTALEFPLSVVNHYQELSVKFCYDFKQRNS